MSKTNTVFLIIGGNLGNRRQELTTAIGLLNQRAGTVITTSSLYETAPWGKPDQQDFLNQALKLETHLQATVLMDVILTIEEKMGRKRMEKNGPRIIDIDILLFGNEVYNEPNVTIPHPRMAARRFVLEPLAEIAGDLIHPIFHKTIRTLLAECNDPLEVKKLHGI